jgi:hypothetical protein
LRCTAIGGLALETLALEPDEWGYLEPEQLAMLELPAALESD